MTDAEKHLFAQERGYPHALFVTPTKYRAIESEGHDMRMYVMVRSMQPSDAPRWDDCPGHR